MADVGMRGTNAAQDSRFKDKEAASIKSTKFPRIFAEKVDLRKVNLSVLRPWIAQKVTELIRIEDDVVVEYAFGMLEDKDNPIPDPKKMQISLVGFMDKHGAAAFMEKLWALLLSAQSTVGGVPAEFIAAKKAELEEKQGNERKLQDTMIRSAQGRAQASDSFEKRRDTGPGLPPRPMGQPSGGPGDRGRPGPPFRRGSPPHDRDNGYRRGPPRRFDDDRERDRGYGGRDPSGRPRSRSRSPGRGYGYRRRSPSPSSRRRSPRRSFSPPPRRRSPAPRRRSPVAPRRRRSPSASQRDRSITPPLRARRVISSEPEARRTQEGTPALRSLSPPPRRETKGRSRSRTPTPSDATSRSVSRTRSPTMTPPRRRKNARESPSPPPPRRVGRSDSRSPSQKRHRDEEDDGMVKKGRGRFTVKDEVEVPTKQREEPLRQSKWAQDE